MHEGSIPPGGTDYLPRGRLPLSTESGWDLKSILDWGYPRSFHIVVSVKKRYQQSKEIIKIRDSVTFSRLATSHNIWNEIVTWRKTIPGKVAFKLWGLRSPQAPFHPCCSCGCTVHTQAKVQYVPYRGHSLRVSDSHLACDIPSCLSIPSPSPSHAANASSLKIFTQHGTQAIYLSILTKSRVSFHSDRPLKTTNWNQYSKRRREVALRLRFNHGAFQSCTVA